jgi:shikimate dehydrogenase
VLTLADLDRWSFTGTALAVLGYPIRHSISPAMHNAALAEMGHREPRFHTWRYFRFEVPPTDLPRALPALHRCGFHGLNLTVPHKVLAFDLVTRVDPAALPIGAVNTLRRTATGWEGFNTDGYGLATAVRESLGCPLTGTPVILLGAGGAARGAAVECLQQGCSSLTIGNRTAAPRDALLASLTALSSAIPLRGFDLAHVPADLPEGALVINATSAGLKAGDAPPLDLARVPSPLGVYDMIYNPPRTALLQQASRLQLPAANGLSMLVHQGVRALELWSAARVPVEVMRSAAFAAL